MQLSFMTVSWVGGGGALKQEIAVLSPTPTSQPSRNTNDVHCFAPLTFLIWVGMKISIAIFGQVTRWNIHTYVR